MSMSKFYVNMVTEFVTNYSNVKDSLFIKLRNAERIGSLLDNVPHRIEDDLVMTYHILLEGNPEHNTAVMITNSLLENYGIDEAQLYNDAMESSVKLFKPSIINIEEALGMPESNIPMWVVTNDQQFNGAAVILYPDVLYDLSKVVGGDMYILPSSIHEVICVPASAETPERLAEIVSEINRNVVAENDQLSDSVYFYNSHTDSWGLAEESSASPLSPQTDSLRMKSNNLN